LAKLAPAAQLAGTDAALLESAAWQTAVPLALPEVEQTPEPWVPLVVRAAWRTAALWVPPAAWQMAALWVLRVARLAV
jgi:hypothetical protein